MFTLFKAKAAVKEKVEVAASEQPIVVPEFSETFLKASAIERQALLEPMQDLDALQALARRIQNKDKRAYHSVKDKIDQIKAQQKNVEQLQQKFIQLCQAIEKHAHSAFDNLYVAKWDYLQTEWKQIASQASAAIQQRFNQANARCEKIYQDQQAQIAQEVKLKAIQEEQTLLQRQLKNLIADYSQQEFSLEAVTTLNALLQQSIQRWQELAQEVNPSPTLQDNYHQAYSLLDSYAKAVAKLEQNQDQLESLKQQAETSVINQDSSALNEGTHNLQQFFNQLNWPSQFKYSSSLALLQQCQTTVTQTLTAVMASQRQRLAELKDNLQKLTYLTQNRELAPAVRVLRKVEELYQSLPETAAGFLHKRLLSLKEKVKELQDWKGFAILPKREELCQRMEALIQADITVADRAKAIKDLQEEWKHLGYVDQESASALWERFQQAGHGAYEPCQQFYKEQAEQRQQNLIKRQELCVKLEQLLQTTDWKQVDWRAIDKTRQQLLQQWQRYFPVDRAKNKMAQEKFDALMQQFNEHIEEEHGRNFIKKRALLKQAGYLPKIKNIEEALDQAKQLQNEWEKASLLPQQDGELWQQFHSICDKIYAQHQQQRQAEWSEYQQQLQKAASLCDQVEQAAKNLASETDSNFQLHKVRVEFEQIALPPEKQRALQQRFEKACRQYQVAIKQSKQSHVLKELGSLARKDSLCCYLEQALLSNLSIEQEPLQQKWQELPPLLTLDPKPIENRWQQLLTYYITTDKQWLQNTTEAALETARLLCVRAEILTEAASPDADKALRMQYQMQRLVQNRNEKATQLDPDLQAQKLLAEWYGIILLKPSDRAYFIDRLTHVLHRLMPVYSDFLKSAGSIYVN